MMPAGGHRPLGPVVEPVEMRRKPHLEMHTYALRETMKMANVGSPRLLLR